jgi:hypothetical protein
VCTKSPKIPEQKQADPQYLTNPLLDGLAINGGQGRNSLRIDRGSTAASTPQPLPIMNNGPSTASAGVGYVVPRGIGYAGLRIRQN